MPWSDRSGGRSRRRHDHEDPNGQCYRRNPDADAQPDAFHPDRDDYADGHHHPDAYADSDADDFPHAFPAVDVHTNSVLNPDEYADVYSLSDADHYTVLDTHADFHTFFHADIDCFSYTFANGHGVPDALPGTMTDIVPFLKSLISAPGLSAYEGPVSHLIEEKWRPLADEVSVSRLGSLHALKRGAGRKHPSIMVAAHMDAIGLIVTRVVEGFLHVEAVGGVDPRILTGTPVTVHAKNDFSGVVVMPPLKTLPEDARGGAVGIPYLLVDVGLLPSKVANLVRVGDLVSFATPPVELVGGYLSGHSLDNRASVAALTVCLEELVSRTHVWDVWAVATSQEEETYGGAATSAFQLNPDLAVTLDVTFAKGPGANDWETFPMGKGITLGWGANLHPFLYKKFKELAERLEIPAIMEVMPTHSGTDAFAIQVARNGIPTMLLEIPLRYMHTPVEMIAVKDVQRVGRLLAEFISGLEADFISKITWDDDAG